ncbi:pyridoxamine 5'-phosphate oxidase family protein [Trichothermofontia sp.]
MAQVHAEITDALRAFIAAQPLFFVATAPLSAQGHVNLWPKGLDSFRVLGLTRVAYLDLTGSGNETSAHRQENGRITFMFFAFQGSPQILRLYGRGRTILPDGPEWPTLFPLFPDLPGARQIIVADRDRVQTSCGFAVPQLAPVGQRDTLIKWAEKQGITGLVQYQRRKNRVSIDGLPTPLGQAGRVALNQIWAKGEG